MRPVIGRTGVFSGEMMANHGGPPRSTIGGIRFSSTAVTALSAFSRP